MGKNSVLFISKYLINFIKNWEKVNDIMQCFKLKKKKKKIISHYSAYMLRNEDYMATEFNISHLAN